MSRSKTGRTVIASAKFQEIYLLIVPVQLGIHTHRGPVSTVFIAGKVTIGIGKRENVTGQQTVFISITVRVFLQFHLKTCHCPKGMVAPAKNIRREYIRRKIIVEGIPTGVRSPAGIFPVHTRIYVSLLGRLIYR